MGVVAGSRECQLLANEVDKLTLGLRQQQPTPLPMAKGHRTVGDGLQDVRFDV